MIKSNDYKSLAFATLVSTVVVLGGCHNNDSSSTTPASTKRTFTVVVSNITANQPMSPIGVVLHDLGFHAWIDGQAASTSLEMMAEGGDNSALLADATANTATLDSEGGAGPVAPGGSGEFTLSADNAAAARLTLFSMLVNTNDAFTGLHAYDLSSLAVGQSISLDLPAYDAGTEKNTEAQGTIPGPADGGEGFNTARDDITSKVTIHPGVVTMDDGLASSVLDQSHRFDNPVARVSITRTE